MIPRTSYCVLRVILIRAEVAKLCHRVGGWEFLMVNGEWIIDKGE